MLLITESENKSRLNEAEKKLRDYIICEDSVVGMYSIYSMSFYSMFTLYMHS